MIPSYSSFKNDILSFNYEEYIKIIHDNNTFNNFSIFLENYKSIEHEDFKKPVFSQTSKFKKIPNNFKNYKYLKNIRDNENNENNEKNEKKNVWTFLNPTEENDKISMMIKTFLNKISEETYKKISNDFINELLLIKNNEIFEILSKEIINKCLFDTKYRSLYINLCYKIWNNKIIHYNLINIINKDTEYYWEYNNEVYGPFNNELNAKNDVFNKINFKKYFIDYIQQLYLAKNFSFENLNEDEIFIKKKKILLLVELIGTIYIEKYINFDIVNIIIIDILHLNNNFKNIEDIEYESLYTLIKLIKDNKKNFNDLIDFKSLFNNFVNTIKTIINNSQLSKRSKFFLEDINLNFELFLSNNVVNKKNIVDDENLLNNFLTKLNNENNSIELYNIYKNINSSYKENIIYKTIDKFISEIKYKKNIINFLIEIKDGNLIYYILEKMIDNIEDIMLDIPNINEKLLYLIDNINYNNAKKINFINILKNINESDSEED